MDKKLLALSALLTTSVIWGITVPLLKVNLETIPPLTLAFLRFALAAVIAISLSELSEINFKDFLKIGFFALFGISIHIGLFLIGLRETSTIDAVFIFAVGPVITSLLAVVTIREKINFSHLLGIILAFIGVLIFTVYPIVANGQNLAINLLGDLLILISTISGSIYVIASKKLFETYKPASISAVSFAIGALSFLPFTFLEFLHTPDWITKVDTFNVLSIIFFGVFSSYIAYTCLEFGLSKLAVHIDATIGYLTSVISVFIAIIFLSEPLEPIFWVSAFFVIVGVYLVGRFHPPSLHPHFHQRHHKV